MSLVRIEIKNKVKPSKKFSQQSKTSSNNQVDNIQYIIFSKQIVDKEIRFNDIVFNKHKMTVRRSGIDDYKVQRIVGDRCTIPIDYDLLGEYELVKIHDELFQLVKIEENGKETEPS